jgi:hypothetical protein
MEAGKGKPAKKPWGPGRTDTKLIIGLTIWACSMVTYLVVWLTQQGIHEPALRPFWKYIAPIITAILGMPGVGLAAVTARKAVESGGLSFAGSFMNRFRRPEAPQQTEGVDDP